MSDFEKYFLDNRTILGEDGNLNVEEENQDQLNSNGNSSQEFEMLMDDGEDSTNYSHEQDGSHVVNPQERIVVNKPTFENTELFELRSVGDDEFFNTEESFVEQIEEDPEKSIRLMDLLESKESCV